MYSPTRFACLTIIAALLPLAAVALNLPAPLKRCRVEDEPCFLQQAQAFVDNYKHGLPDRQLPDFAMVPLGTLQINSGGPSDSIQFNLVMRNTTLHKFADNCVFKTMKGFTRDLTKPLKITWSTSTTGVEVHADYDVKGKMLILPIVSSGKLIISLGLLQSKSRINAVPEKREDGHTYLKVIDYKSIAKVSSGHFNMTNLFQNNVELHESTMKVLNDEWSALSADIQPKITEATDRVLKGYLQKFLDTLPYDEFYEN